jgi:hypothetical protein
MKNTTALNLATQILDSVYADMLQRTRGVVYKNPKERRKVTAEILKLERIRRRLIRFAARLEDPVLDIGNTYQVTGQDEVKPKGLIE